MLVVVSSPDEARAEQLRDEVRAAGHEVVLQRVGDTLVDVDVVVMDWRTERLAHTITLAKATARAVLLFGPVEALAQAPPGVDHLAVEPLAPGELAARLAHVDRLGREVTIAQLHAAAVEASGDIVEIAGADIRLVYVNPAYERAFGYARKEVVGHFPAEFIRSDHHPPEFYAEIGETMRAGRVWRGIIVSRARDGRDVFCEAISAPVLDADGVPTHFLCVRRDVTERLRHEEEIRRANEELAAARDEALEANRVKSQFLANMSHELRTPLNAIIGYSELLAEDAAEVEGGAELVEDLGKIRGAGTRLLGLVDDVLDLSRLEAGRLSLELEEVDLAELLREVTDARRPRFEARGNRLSLRVDGPCVARVDRARVRQVLQGLLSNANKFTERGDVWVSLGGDAARARIEVTDTGIGMSAEQRARLFQPFVQADDSSTRRYGGVGLGLAIGQRLCEMMGGAIEAQSEPGVGSVFIVTLPRRRD